MNRKALTLPSAFLIFGIPVTLIITAGVLAKVMTTGLYHSEISTALVYDLTIAIPLLYLLLITKRKIPKITVVPIFIIGLVVASLTLPLAEQQHLDDIITYGLPAIESLVFLIVVYKIIELRKRYKHYKQGEPDVFIALKSATGDILPTAISKPFAYEMIVLYFSFVAWGKSDVPANGFTSHKKGGLSTLLALFIGLIMMETFALHLALYQWVPIAALILTILSSYTALQILGMSKSLKRRPILLEDQVLKVRYGLFGSADIALSKITGVRASSKTKDEKEDMAVKVSPLKDFDKHNIVLSLSEPEILHGLYGKKSEFKTLLMRVDDTDRFVEELNLRINPAGELVA
jgi:hypothetical protein